MRIDLACAVCGKNRFSLEGAEDDGSLIYCEECGHKIGTLGKLKERIAQEVLRRRNEPN